MTNLKPGSMYSAGLATKAIGKAGGRDLSIDRPTMQFAMGEVMAGKKTPLVMRELLLHKVARYVLEYPTET